jgi:hypothetical protein
MEFFSFSFASIGGLVRFAFHAKDKKTAPMEMS